MVIPSKSNDYKYTNTILLKEKVGKEKYVHPWVDSFLTIHLLFTLSKNLHYPHKLLVSVTKLIVFRYTEKMKHTHTLCQLWSASRDNYVVTAWCDEGSSYADTLVVKGTKSGLDGGSRSQGTCTWLPYFAWLSPTLLSSASFSSLPCLSCWDGLKFLQALTKGNPLFASTLLLRAYYRRVKAEASFSYVVSNQFWLSLLLRWKLKTKPIRSNTQKILLPDK